MTGALEFPNSDLFSKDKEKLSLQNTCLCLCVLAPQFSSKISIFGNGMELSNAESFESIRSVLLVLSGLLLI